MKAQSEKESFWNAGLYDDRHSFVYEYGEELVNLLDPKRGERILDLGCGTGQLTARISAAEAIVTGLDNSAEMIKKAREAFPWLDFQLGSAVDYRFEEGFDAIFSNAALHWIIEKEKAVDNMYRNLKNKGRIVIEMGGKNNVDSILKAIRGNAGEKRETGASGKNSLVFPFDKRIHRHPGKQGFQDPVCAVI